MLSFAFVFLFHYFYYFLSSSLDYAIINVMENAQQYMERTGEEMKGSEAKMTGFMEGADKRYVIPVYQRKYDWKNDNCRQLYEDLKKIVLDQRDSHFFGVLCLR